MLAQSLTNDYGYEVDYKNFGVSGNTSNQILKRMKEDGELISYLKTADLLTLTVGGNDLRKAIIKNIANLKVSTFDKPAKITENDWIRLLRQRVRIIQIFPSMLSGFTIHSTSIFLN